MTDSNLISYIGMATGIIGAVTGATGAILGVLSYRKVNKLKSLDLRLEYRKAVTETDSLASSVGQLIKETNGTRITLAAASGRSKSGFMEQWEEQTKKDKARVQELRSNIPRSDNGFLDLSTNELETALVDIHKTKVALEGYQEKYNKAKQEDKEQSAFLREKKYQQIRGR